MSARLDESDLVCLPMRTDDISQVIEIERQSFPSPWSRLAYLSEISENDKAVYIVAKRGERVIGYTGMWLVFDEAHITTLAVDPGERRKGVGRMLLRKLTEIAKSRGISRMTLEVRKSNHQAYLLYRSEGFVPVGIRPGYYRDNNEDAIIMWKDQL